MIFTSSEVEKIDVGTLLMWGLDGYHYTGPFKVVEITCKRKDMNGKLFVHGYHEWSENSRMSFSIKAGSEIDGKLYKIV